MSRTTINSKRTYHTRIKKIYILSSVVKTPTSSHFYELILFLYYIRLIDLRLECIQRMKSKSKRELTEREKKLNEYYWKCFLSEFSKICIFLVIFILLGLTKEYLFALLYLMILRNNGGGLHCKHYTSCLLVSFTFLYSSIMLAIHITPSKPVSCTSILLCALLGYFLVPVTSSNRPAATPNQITKSKRNTIIIILLFFILICFCPYNIYIFIGYWTVTLHIIQLIIAHITKEVTANG